MKIESLRIGMKVRHPQYGLGEVKSIAEATASVLFGEGPRTVSPETSGLEPAEPTAAVSGLEMPLEQFLRRPLQPSSRAWVTRIRILSLTNWA